MFNLHDRFACFTFQPDDSALKTWKEAKENAERQVCRVEIYNKYFLSIMFCFLSIILMAYCSFGPLSYNIRYNKL